MSTCILHRKFQQPGSNQSSCKVMLQGPCSLHKNAVIKRKQYVHLTWVTETNQGILAGSLGTKDLLGDRGTKYFLPRGAAKLEGAEC